MMFHIWSNGDPSVGIPGDQATLTTDVDCYDGDDRKHYINQIKFALKQTFSEIWNSKVTVMTDKEVE